MKVRIQFKPRDLWIGVFVDRVLPLPDPFQWVRRVYVCLVPCFPIVFEWEVPE